MTKEWEEKQKPGSDSLSGKLNSASNKEVDRSAAYGPSFGYGDIGYGDIGYGPSLEETARSLQPTGKRRSANFSRIAAEPNDELATSAKDGKPPVNEDSNNNLANNKGTSKGDDKPLGSNFQENLISTTFLLPGENFEIEIPKDIKLSDPHFNFEIQVKTLVKKFKFEANDARELINYLSQPGRSTGITVLGPVGPRSALVNVGKDMAIYYRKAAADRRQTKVNAQREQQRLDVQRKQELSNLRQSYVKGLRQYSSDVRNQLNQLFLSLSAEHRQNIEAKTDELYRKIESSDLNLELREAIRIAVMNQWFPTNVQKILNGKPPAQNQSRPATTPPQNNNTRPPSSNLKQPATSQPRQPAANQPRQSATNQPRQSATESNNDTRWQATARSFQEQFATNYSREQIIVIQRLVGATPDGNYGEETAQKVYQWQQNHRVPNPDGLVGDVTHRAMVAQLRTTNTAAADILSPQQKAPPPPIAAPTNPVRNATDSRTQLEAFSPAIKTLLGRQETSQTENYPQLLRVGNKLQQLPPEEFEYIYQPFASNLAGDLTGLERSIDIFTNTRSQVIAELQSPGRTYLGQRVNTTLFGEKPLTSNPSWQQVLKDLIASVLQSPNHAPEILGEVFDFLKEHWVQFVGLTVALMAAQASVAALTGIPEPTFLSKVLAVALQGFILAVYGVGIVVSVEGAIGELMNWWNAASKANGDPEQIASASRSFLRMVGNLILLIISSRQFQAQLKPEKLARLQEMLNRRQQASRLPDAYEGTTVDLVPDPDNPNSYVYKLQPNPNAQKLPPSSRPSIDITNQTPPAPRPSGGGGSGIIPTRPASIPSTSPTTPGRSTPPAPTGQIANPEQTVPQQVQQPQVPDTLLPPVTAGGELTPPTSSSPVTNPNQTTFADSPQPPNLGILPPQTTEGQLVVPSQPSTTGSESISLPTASEAIGRLLSGELGRNLNPEQVQAALQGNLERQDIERLVRSAASWDRVKLNYVSYPALMEAIIKYRERVVFETVTEVFNSNEEFKQLDTLITGDGQILGNMTEMVAAGSTDLTSDYDVTFSAGAGNEALEILAVEKFNQLFRERWGLESGVVFDTNVYTSGHMRSAAFKGDGAKLNLVNKLAKELKKFEEIVEEGNPLYERQRAEKRAEINDLVAQVNTLGTKGNPARLAPLEEGNLRAFTRQITKLQASLTETVKQQYQESKNAYGAGPEFDELATVMSLVHMREFWNQGQPSGANWTRVEQRMTSGQVPENVRNLNRVRLNRAGEIHEELVTERRRKIEHLRQENPNLANNEANLEMMANNLLEVEYLHRVREKLTQIRAAEQSGQASEQVESLKLELQELQSKTLFFANEAYMTAISAEQVVLNQQIKLGVKLPTAQYTASINEQTAFVGEQLAHLQDNFGKALWKTAKYIDRILTAIRTIHKETDGRVPSQEVMARTAQLEPLVEELLSIKKNGAFTDAQKNQAATNLAQANPSVLGSNTAELGRIILDLQTDVNLEIQNHLNLPNQTQ